ncbi:MAG: hypothetical protein ACD_79C01124G0003 [uncultured bacterium]|nr:MAG: hypothetical protein ACD_79C01124G0003 [uncultured bacterium]
MKNCQYCGRFFKPHPRLGNRQKCCDNPACKKKRKKESQKNWTAKNPDYFKGLYAETKEWRKKNQGRYQRKWRKKHREIQDSIVSG